MANHITITNIAGDQFSLSLPLSCFAVLIKLVIQKYNPDFDQLTNDINKELEPVYKNCEKYEEVMMLLFLNSESEFTKHDVEHFNKAIEKYPDDINQRPKQVLEAFRDFLKDNHPLITKYSHSTSAMMVQTKP